MGNPATDEARSFATDAEAEGFATRSRSFAELVAALQRLNELESALATAIARAKVPVQEVRKLLRARTPTQAENAPAFQFMREIFAQIGLPLAIAEVHRFAITFRVDASSYARLLRADDPRKAWSFVGDALARFFETDFEIPADVVEVTQGDAQDPVRWFEVRLQPAAVRTKALDGTDWKLVHLLAREVDLEVSPDTLGMTLDEFEFRMEALVGYGIASQDGKLLPEGRDLLEAGPHPTVEPFEPPWREVSRLTDSIAHATSFAEALVEVAPKEVPRDSAGPDRDLAAVAAECRSFAELLARTYKGRSSE